MTTAEKFRNAIVGLLLVLTSYLFLQAINPKLVQIPVGLVPQLKIDESRFLANKDFFDQLTQDADRFHVQGEQHLENAIRARAEVRQLEQSLSELEEKLLNEQQTGDPNQTVTEQQIQDLKNQIVKKQGKALLDNTRALMRGSVPAGAVKGINSIKAAKELTVEAIWGEINNGLQIIESERKDRIERASDIGAYEIIDTPGGINDTARAAFFDLQVTGIDATVNNIAIQEAFANTISGGLFTDRVNAVIGSRSLGEYREVYNDISTKLENINKQIDTVRDPELRKSLHDKVQNSRSELEKKFNPQV